MNNINTVDPIDALKMSIQSEKEMKAYYKKAASLQLDEDAQTILLGLADHSDKHRKSAIEMYSKFSGKKILYLNLDKRHKLNSLLRCSDDPNDAVRIAKKNEKELGEFYAVISRRFAEADLRSFFRQMAMENHQHLTLLEASFAEPLTLDQENDDEEDVLDQVTSENPVKTL